MSKLWQYKWHTSVVDTSTFVMALCGPLRPARVPEMIQDGDLASSPVLLKSDLLDHMEAS